MKLNKLAGLGIASIVLFSSVGLSSLNVQPAQAQTAGQSIRVASIPQSVISSGSFVTTEQDHPTNGKAKIVKVNGKRYLEFDKAFTTARGPKVRVVLHRNSTVPVNLKQKDYVTLAALQRFNGAQRYEIPASINLNNFKSVAIWCEQFNVTFGYANLQGA